VTGKTRAGRGPTHAIAGRGYVGRPTHHAFFAKARAHAHDAQLVGVRVRLDVQHFGHQHTGKLPSLCFATFDLKALLGECMGHGLKVGSPR